MKNNIGHGRSYKPLNSLFSFLIKFKQTEVYTNLSNKLQMTFSVWGKKEEWLLILPSMLFLRCNYHAVQKVICVNYI